jgi:hypothetical protein
MKIYKEQLVYRDNYSIGLFILISMLLAVSVFQKLNISSVITGLSLVVGAITIYYLIKAVSVQLPIKLNISSKKIKVKNSLKWKRDIEIRRDSVKEIKFIALSESDMFSGWNVNFNNHSRVIDTGSHKGILVTSKDEKTYFICSSNLYENRKDIALKMVEQGWPIHSDS